MSDRPACAQVRPELPELALGTLMGEERARALEHLAGCPHCRRELARLGEVGDELLRIAPTAQPPVGFELRALERLLAPEVKPRAPRWRAAVAAAALAALLAGSAVYLVGGADRELATSYRRTLSVADGEYFGARPLRNETGAAVGHVFGYQGSPSWVFCLVRAGHAEGTYRIEVTVEGGETWAVGEMRVAEGKQASWAQTLDVDLHEVERITLVERGGDERFVAAW
jgi:hypothetical protein